MPAATPQGKAPGNRLRPLSSRVSRKRIDASEASSECGGSTARVEWTLQKLVAYAGGRALHAAALCILRSSNASAADGGAQRVDVPNDSALRLFADSSPLATVGRRGLPFSNSAVVSSQGPKFLLGRSSGNVFLPRTLFAIVNEIEQLIKYCERRQSCDGKGIDIENKSLHLLKKRSHVINEPDNLADFNIMLRVEFFGKVPVDTAGGDQGSAEEKSDFPYTIVMLVRPDTAHLSKFVPERALWWRWAAAFTACQALQWKWNFRGSGPHVCFVPDFRVSKADGGVELIKATVDKLRPIYVRQLSPDPSIDLGLFTFYVTAPDATWQRATMFEAASGRQLMIMIGVLCKWLFILELPLDEQLEVKDFADVPNDLDEPEDDAVARPVPWVGAFQHEESVSSGACRTF